MIGLQPRDSRGQDATVAGRLLIRSRYLAWYASASASLTHASPSRSTENAIPSFHRSFRFPSALAASVPAMNFDAIDLICPAIVEAVSPLASPRPGASSPSPAGV